MKRTAGRAGITVGDASGWESEMSLTVVTVVLLAGLLVFVPVGAIWTRTQRMVVGRRAALWAMLGAFLSAWLLSGLVWCCSIGVRGTLEEALPQSFLFPRGILWPFAPEWSFSAVRLSAAVGYALYASVLVMALTTKRSAFLKVLLLAWTFLLLVNIGGCTSLIVSLATMGPE